jgi:hypothetical protein
MDNIDPYVLLPTPHLQSQSRELVRTIQSRVEVKHKILVLLALVESKWGSLPWLVDL